MPGIQIQSRIAGLQRTDEKTWNAVNIAGSIDGEIINCAVDDEGTIHWENDFPIDIPFGHQIRVHFNYVNTGTVTAQFYTTITLIDPDGIERAIAEGNQPLDPGWQKGSARTDWVTLDKFGIWVIHGLLEVMV